MKAVILAGGGGTRLWPLSTKDRPKQFQKLVSDKTMLEETIERLDFLNPEDIYLAINENHLDLHFKILDEFKTIKRRLDNYSVIDLRVSNQLIVKENSYIKS